MSTKDISDVQVCEAYRAYRADKSRAKWPYEILSERTGQPEKVCYRAMERACRRNLIEYGVSLRTGWLTPEGLALLAKSEAK